MSGDPVLTTARSLWQELASTPVSFGPADHTSVVVSPDSRLCPSGWVGAVVLGGAAIVTTPDEDIAARVGTAVSRLPVTDLTDSSVMREALRFERFLGPAALAYLSADGFRPSDDLVVEQLPAGHEDLARLEAATGDDFYEACLDEITSPAFVVYAEGEAVAAAGYRDWPVRTAQIGVVTVPSYRGRGLARATGSAAVRHALARDMLPQWRARIPESRKVAVRLGFRELGSQLSFALSRA